MFPKKFTKTQRRIIYTFISIAFIFIILQFAGVPIIKNFIKKTVFEKSQKIYSLDFDKFKINWFTGKIIITDVSLNADTALFLHSQTKSEFLFKLRVDTFYVVRINPWNLFHKGTFLKIKDVSVVNPQLSVYKKIKKDSLILLDNKNINYDTVKNNVFSSFLNTYKGIRIREFIIKNGNINFLKPGTSKANLFSIGSITYKLSDFELTKEKFFRKDKGILAQDFELFIDDYHLAMKDDVHQLSAKKIYLNSQNGLINLKDVRFEPISEKNRSKVPALMYFSLDSISLFNVNIKDFLQNRRLHLSHSIIDGFSANIQTNKNYKKVKKKVILDKDTLISKVDIYKYIKAFLTDIQIDTIKVRHCTLKKFNSYNSPSPQIAIAEFDADIYDFLLDSTSFADTSRLAFAKNIETRIYGMQYLTKDTSHLINVDYLVFSTTYKGLLLKNVSIKPVLKYQGHSFDKIVNIDLSSVNISGFDFKKYFHFNEIKIKNIDIPFFEANYKVFHKKSKNKNKNEIRKILDDFAKTFLIENLNIKQGNIDYSSNISDKKTAVNSGFYANFNKINIDFSKNKITQIATVNRADIKFNRIKFRTSDSLYNIKVDSAVYSSALSYVDIYNLSVIPNDSTVSFLVKKNKSMTVTFTLPFFEIDKNNLINALEKDSLGLSTVTLQDATIDLKLYPAIAAKKSKKTKVDSLKKIAIKNIMTYYDIAKMLNYSDFPQFDSAGLATYKLQSSYLDTICKVTIRNVLSLKVKQNQISLKDTSLWIIDSIFNTFVTYSKNVDKIKDSADFEIYSDKCITKIKYLKKSFETSKIDLKTIFNTISLYLARINVDTFSMTNTKLNVLKFEKGNYENIFNTMMNARILGFQFDTTSEFKKFLFSENVIFDLRDIKSSRENYAFRTDLLHFSSADSVVRLQNCSLNLKSENKKILDFYANSISLTGIDLVKVIIDSTINLRNFNLQNSRINYYLGKKSSQKNKKVITTVFLPKAFKIANLENINLKDVKVSVFDSTMSEFVSFNTDIHLKNFFIDSVTYPLKNKYFIPVDNISFTIRDLRFRNHDTSNIIQAKSASYNSLGQKFLLTGFDYKTFKKDSAGKSNIKTHFTLDSLDFAELNYNEIRFNNKLIINRINISNPVLFLTKNKRKKQQKLDIKNIDLYGKIKKYFQLVNIEDFNVENIAIYQKNDSLKRIDTINDISIKIKGFYVDSTAKIDTPRLLYADDIRLKIRDKKIYLDSDSIYSLSFENLNLSMNSGYVQISGIEIKPRTALNKVQNYYRYRTTAISGKISNLAVMNIDWKKLIFDNYFETKLIFIDSADIATFVDLNAPHNSSHQAKHLIEPVFVLPFPISVDMLKIMNFNVVYYELSAKNHQTAYISLNQGKINISNLTNDSSLIAESKPYTKISLYGKINDVAPVKIDVVYMLRNKGNIAQVTGSFGKCKADIFNTYLYNSANLTLDEGQIDSVYFTFTTYDSLAVGKMIMKYKHLKTSLIKNDTLNRKKMKFVSWIVNTLVVRRNNPRFGPVPKVAGIAYIHDRSYGDLKMWVKAILSGVQATVAFKPKDARRINKIRRKNSYLNKYFTD